MLKTTAEKIQEIKTIYNKLSAVGLHKKNADIKKFQKIVNLYIKSDESFSGKIRIHGTDRILKYVLPKTNKHECRVVLKFSPL